MLNLNHVVQILKVSSLGSSWQSEVGGGGVMRKRRRRGSLEMPDCAGKLPQLLVASPLWFNRGTGFKPEIQYF